MKLNWLTPERLVALAVVAIQIVAAILFSPIAPDTEIIALWAFVLSLPGLVLIWYREAVSQFAFMRGVYRESPPQLVDIIGWLFLIGLPLIYLYDLLP